MDTLDLHPNALGQVELVVNGTPLLQLVHDVELPFAEAECDERIAGDETPDNLGVKGSLAGQYAYQLAQHTFLPCENFFGAPYNHGFLNAPKTKSLLLECTCGITDCWFLLADIHVGDDVVTWSNFEQFHREWSYDGLGSFTFDRDSYDRLFLPPPSADIKALP